MMDSGWDPREGIFLSLGLIVRWLLACGSIATNCYLGIDAMVHTPYILAVAQLLGLGIPKSKFLGSRVRNCMASG